MAHVSFCFNFLSKPHFLSCFCLIRILTLFLQYPGSQGTVKPFPGFNPQEDAQALRKAMKGFGEFWNSMDLIWSVNQNLILKADIIYGFTYEIKVYKLFADIVSGKKQLTKLRKCLDL